MVTRFVPIGLAVVAFVATYVICTRNPGADGQGPGQNVVATVQPARPQSPVSEPKFAAPTQQAVAPMQPRVAPPSQDSAAPESIANDEETHHDPADDMVPVMVRLGPGNGSERAVTVRNGAPQPLDLTVTADNTNTGAHSIVQVTVAPYANTDVTATGLVVGHGDRITIESPPYRDRVIHVQ